MVLINLKDMNDLIMNSTEAKIALLSYCRFARQMHYVATEVSVPGDALADVLASDSKNLVEYEVKISMADLRNDSKKYKHLVYDPTPIVWEGNVGTKKDKKFEIRNGEPGTWRPHLFYVYEGEVRNFNGYTTFEKAKESLEKQIGSMANVPNMLYYVLPDYMWEKHEEKILAAISDEYGVITFTGHNYHGLEVKKKAKKLHKNPVNELTLRTIAARMSSELAALTMAHYHSTSLMTELGKRLSDRMELNDGLNE